MTQTTNKIKERVYFLCINTLTTINHILLKKWWSAYSIAYDINYKKQFLNYVECIRKSNIEYSKDNTLKCTTDIYVVDILESCLYLADVCTIKNGDIINLKNIKRG